MVVAGGGGGGGVAEEWSLQYVMGHPGRLESVLGLCMLVTQC